MEIRFKQDQIEQAMHQYIETQGISLKNKQLRMEFVNGRKSNGLSVEVEIMDATPKASVATITPTPIIEEEVEEEEEVSETPVEAPNGSLFK